MRKLLLSVLLFTLLALLTSCSSSDKVDGQEENEQEEASTSEDERVIPIELTSYANEIGATIRQPESQVFSVEQAFALAGDIRDADQLQGTYIWVVMDGPDGGSFDYYIPIEDGQFTSEIKLFEGEGAYDITIRAPDKQLENHFYDIATLEVTNESSDIMRDIAMRPSGLEAGLQLSEPTSGYVEAEETVRLAGTVSEEYNGQNVMIKVTKDADTSDMLLQIRDGRFTGNIPLYYGAGFHDITVMVPDLSQENYYLESATIIVNNVSATVMEPIDYYKHYYEQKFHLDDPIAGGLTTGETFRVAGSFDPNLESNQNVEQLIVTTKKDGEEASYLIPVNNGQFDGEFWLRFGPGEYEVTLNVPTNPGAEQSYFQFAGVASFRVNSEATDQRYLMPSRGIQSDAPDIGKLATDLTRGKQNDREKVKTVYEYVAKTVAYDVQKLENDSFKLDDSALKTLETKKGVCQDYAFLAVALLRSVGIESRYVGGIAQSSPQSAGERHAWVEAKVDGEWLVMDPTWGSGYIQDGQFVANYDDKYFDPDPQQFAETHTREETIY